MALRLSTYRKLKPTPLEEVIFYDHPSGYDRVHRAMTWLAENQSAGRRAQKTGLSTIDALARTYARCALLFAALFFSSLCLPLPRSRFS
ncbi:MAG: hypothetical protein ACXW5U_24265 [Thermoanaerobaculia bacterium]